MSIRRDKWCYWHTICKEDFGKNTFTCTAHLAEGRAMQCYRKKEDVVYDPNRREYHHGLRLPGCEDFEALEGKVRTLQRIAESQV